MTVDTKIVSYSGNICWIFVDITPESAALWPAAASGRSTELGHRRRLSPYKAAAVTRAARRVSLT